MEKKSHISFITTVLNAIFGGIDLIFIVAAVYALTNVSDVFDVAGKTITEAGNHDLTGGYEVIGGLGLGALGVLGVFAIILIIFVAIVILLMILSTIVVGLVSRSKYKKNEPIKFIADAVVKLVVDGIIAIVSVSSISMSQPWWIVVSVVPVAVVVLCIISILDSSKDR